MPSEVTLTPHEQLVLGAVVRACEVEKAMFTTRDHVKGLVGKYAGELPPVFYRVLRRLSGHRYIDTESASGCVYMYERGFIAVDALGGSVAAMEGAVAAIKKMEVSNEIQT